jgi:antitoxin (DNA-binding transcriptional repressor) of toxin-antitoxin stability system
VRESQAQSMGSFRRLRFAYPLRKIRLHQILRQHKRNEMKHITATELARRLSEILDRLASEGDEIVIERNHRQVARLVPGPGRLTAVEAMADIYRTLPEDAASSWEADSRANLKGSRLSKGLRNPWDS